MKTNLILELPPGVRFEPLHKACPQCGCHLLREPVDTAGNQYYPYEVEEDPDRPGFARIVNELPVWAEDGSPSVIVEFAKANKERARRYVADFLKRVRRKGARTAEDENGETGNH